MIGTEDGLVVDGTIVSEDWAQHTDVIVFVQDGSPDDKFAWPLWARAPVLPSQAPLLERAFEQRTPTGTPELRPPTPTVPSVTPPTPSQGLTPQAPVQAPTRR